MKNAVLEILRKEARASAAGIARRIGCSEAEAEAAIKELEESRTVLGYQAVIDEEKLDHEPCVGLIEVKINPQRARGYDAIASQIYRYPEVRDCYLLSGIYDVLVVVEGPTLKSVALFVSEKLATIDCVEGTATHFILKKYKQFGVIMGGNEKAERLAITP